MEKAIRRRADRKYGQEYDIRAEIAASEWRDPVPWRFREVGGSHLERGDEIWTGRGAGLKH